MMPTPQHGPNITRHPSTSDETDTKLLSEIKINLSQGTYQGVGERHRITSGALDGIDCFDLHDPARLSLLLDHYCQAKYPNDDRRAAISMWSQWYFGLLLSPLLVMGAAGEVLLPFEAGFINLKSDDTNCPTGFDLVDRRVRQTVQHPLAPDPWIHFHDLITNHLRPLIASLSTASKVSPKVFWSNVGVVIAHVENSVLKEHRISLTPLITDVKGPDGMRNPLANPYSTKQSEGGSLSRRVCCLRYLLTSVDICSTCPLAKI
ncbi:MULTISPECIES: siderophore-iron reductase FhuF [Pseudomonadota]|uniref:siderophore-iron reductase FhuF n=1 Tax=Pseudomonadota TaxID=1224 RepID=UPI003A8F3211